MTRNTLELSETLKQFQKTPLIVEGKRDAAALEAFGFSRVFILNEHHGSLRERIERIVNALSKEEKEICLLFDNDTAGRKLIAQCAPILHELGIRTHQALRREFIKAGLSHVEGLTRFLSRSSKKTRQGRTSGWGRNQGDR